MKAAIKKRSNTSAAGLPPEIMRITAKAMKPIRPVVIITTSISGRGVDIKLGGQDQSQKEEIKKIGGLFVIGTERMESRRVDNQARGRSGRQGDEGNSIFYVSLEDDLMRIFGSESIDGVMKKFGLKEGEDKIVGERIAMLFDE